MAIVQFEKNGQGYFDFNLLEEETCPKFVNEIKMTISAFEKLEEKFELKLDLSSKVIKKVYMVTSSTIIIFKFYRPSMFEQITLLKSEIKDIAGALL